MREKEITFLLLSIGASVVELAVVMIIIGVLLFSHLYPAFGEFVMFLFSIATKEADSLYPGKPCRTDACRYLCRLLLGNTHGN